MCSADSVVRQLRLRSSLTKLSFRANASANVTPALSVILLLERFNTFRHGCPISAVATEVAATSPH